MKQLIALINELEVKIPHSEKINTTVSKTAVGWHIQHAILVISQIIYTVENSNPADYKYKFSLSRFLVYTLNKIPRGKAKAPDRVMPREPFNVETLKQDIQILKSRVDVLNTLQPDNFFIHPMFGHLNLKPTIKMLKLHTKHHIDIINDIVRRS